MTAERWITKPGETVYMTSNYSVHAHVVKHVRGTGLHMLDLEMMDGTRASQDEVFQNETNACEVLEMSLHEAIRGQLKLAFTATTRAQEFHELLARLFLDKTQPGMLY
jgi:hypothetical protein